MADDFNEAIRSIVSEHWDRTGRVVHLSQLGGLLNRSFDLPKAMNGAKLLPYLQVAEVRELQAEQIYRSINGVMRLGALYQSSFHYDTTSLTGETISLNFYNSDSKEIRIKNKKNLNIYCNDELGLRGVS